MPESAVSAGVLIVAGQPQTRVGAHRMFVQMARMLAPQGLAVLRFDCSGWGDSVGDALPFEISVADIAVASAVLLREIAPVRKFVLVGLCDGATAAALALPAVGAAAFPPAALCLINPWVRSEATHAESLLKTYYWQRLLEPGLYIRLLSGKVPVRHLLEPLRALKKAWAGAGPAGRMQVSMDPANAHALRDEEGGKADNLPAKVLEVLERARTPIWTVLCGKDLTAGELDALLSRSSHWRRVIDRPESVLRLAQADHTFTSRRYLAEACQWIGFRCKRL